MTPEQAAEFEAIEAMAAAAVAASQAAALAATAAARAADAAVTAVAAAQRAQTDSTTAIGERVHALQAAIEGVDPPPPPPPPTNGFTVTGATIVDPDGKAFVPRGLNVTGADSYLWDGAFDATGQAAYWAGRGLNAIRLVHCRTCASHGPGSHHYGDLDALIAEYTARKMVVLVDNHEGQLGASNGKTKAEVDQAIEFFVPLATKHRDNPYVWYEPFNEPVEEGWAVPAARLWVDFTEPVIAAIRAAAPNSVIVPCTSHFGQDRASSAAVVEAESAIMTFGPALVAKYGNLVFDIHIYSRWGDGQASDATMDDYFARLHGKGLAVLVGETGGYSGGTMAVKGDDTGTKRLYRTHPTGVGIFPWMMGDFRSPGGNPSDCSQQHWAWVAAQRGGSVDPPPPPPPAGTVPATMTATGEPGAVRLRWTNPATAAGLRVFIAWGAGSYLGQITLIAGTTEHVVPGLAVKPHSFDIGYHLAGGTVGTLVRVDATPLAGGTVDPPPPPPTGSGAAVTPGQTGPAAGTTLQTVASAVDLARLTLPGTWDAAQQTWAVPSCPPTGFKGLHVMGALYYTGAAPLVMEDCIVSNSGSSFVLVFCAPGSGAPRLRRCKIERPTVNPSTPYGAGAIEFNGQNDGWVEHCDISGNADGIQLSGNNHSISWNWIHSLVTTGSSHNDGIQQFSGSGIRIVENFFDLDVVAAHSNACIFTQGGSIGTLLIQGNRFRGSGTQIAAQNGQLTIIGNSFEQPRLFGAMSISGTATVVAQSANTGL